MELLQQVIHRSKSRVYNSPKLSHIVWTQVSPGSDGDCLDLPPRECLAPRRISVQPSQCQFGNPFNQHCQSSKVGIFAKLVPLCVLNRAVDIFMVRNETGGVEQVQVWQLTIEALVYHLKVVKVVAVFPVLHDNGSVNRPCRDL